MICIRRRKTCVFLLAIIVITSVIPFVRFFSQVSELNIDDDGFFGYNNNFLVRPKTSGNYDLTGSRIFIDDADPNYNWSKTAMDNDWCWGSGTFSNPYVIENVTINGLYNKNCIEIQNSNVYFILRNCTLFNAGGKQSPLTYYSGIYLYQVSSGIVSNNNLSYDNGYGIHIEQCNNITITKNTVNHNYRMGIYLKDSDYNYVENNTINDSNSPFESNSGNGIWVSGSSDYNVFYNNSIQNTVDAGIAVYGTYNNFTEQNVKNCGEISLWEAGITEFSHHNRYINCTLESNPYAGIYFHLQSHHSYVEGCRLLNNGLYGIRMYGTEDPGETMYHTIYGNIFEGNDVGLDIHGLGCHSHVISYNDFYTNRLWDVLIRFAEGNTLFGNNFYSTSIRIDDSLGPIINHWNTSEMGNFWSNYIGNDTNDDGIGDSPHVFDDVIDYLPLYRDGPSITIIKPHENKIYSNPPEFVIRIIDPTLDKLWYTIHSFSTKYFFTSNGTVNKAAWLNCPEGTVIVRFHANDSVGNEQFRNISVLKDTAAPEITINSPVLNQVYGFMAPEFNISIFDMHSINKTWYTINGGLTNYTFSGLNGSINQSTWSEIESGNVVVRFYDNDSAGNYGFLDVSIWKDLIPPVITLISPTPNQLCGVNAPAFSLAIDEPNIQLKQYSINGRPNITFTIETHLSQSEWNNAGNGTVTITFYVIDKVGNTNSSEVIVRKDANLPTIIIDSPLQAEQFNNSPPGFNISIVEEDLVSSWYTIDGVVGTFSFSELAGYIDQNAWIDAPEGEVTITFFASDRAGNIGSQSVTVIKNIPPSSTIPGYNLLFLLGILTVTIIIVSKKTENS